MNYQCVNALIDIPARANHDPVQWGKTAAELPKLQELGLWGAIVTRHWFVKRLEETKPLRPTWPGFVHTSRQHILVEDHVRKALISQAT